MPYVIWQTWKDTMPLRKRYEGISSMPQVTSPIAKLEASSSASAQPVLETVKGGCHAI